MVYIDHFVNNEVLHECITTWPWTWGYKM